MNQKINIGILVFGDPTRGGTITSEVKFLNSLYENNLDCNFFIITVNKTITNRISKNEGNYYSFPHEMITVFSENDFNKLDNFSCLVTYPGHSNFFGGMLNPNNIKMYKIISYCTNKLDIPVFVRINDSEIKVRDYRHMAKVRLDMAKADEEAGIQEKAFIADKNNAEQARDILLTKEWNYDNVYWFANGSKHVSDWVSETLYDREDKTFRVSNKENYQKNSIYVSDDIFFQVKKKYSEFKELRKNTEIKEKLCYIGFFDTVNMNRAKALNKLFKENIEKVPLKIFGKGTEILSKFQNKPNVEIEEGYIKGDSLEFYEFLNSHLAYIFIGKGLSESRYIGKTVYDAVIAGTPVLVYSKCDSNQITFKSKECYFEDEKELKVLFEKLKDFEYRKRIVDEQKEEIMNSFPEEVFKFDKYCREKENLEVSLFHDRTINLNTGNQIIKKQEETKKVSVSLF